MSTLSLAETTAENVRLIINGFEAGSRFEKSSFVTSAVNASSGNASNNGLNPRDAPGFWNSLPGFPPGVGGLKAGANADSAATNLRTVIDLLPLACAGFSPAKNAQHQILYLIEESTCNRDVMVCMANEAARMRVTEAEGAVFVRLFVCPSRVLR